MEGVVRQQIAGLPMGIAPAPQLANICCHITERTHVEQQRSLNWHTVRFIDGIFTTDDERLPSQKSYGMEYSETGRGSNVPYIGARVYKEASGKMRTSTTVKRTTCSISHDTLAAAPSRQQPNDAASSPGLQQHRLEGRLPVSSFAELHGTGT